MGNGVKCVTTLKSRVTQGDAKPPVRSHGGLQTCLNVPFSKYGEPRALVAISCCRCLTCFARVEMKLGMGFVGAIHVQLRASWGLQTMLTNVGVF